MMDKKLFDGLKISEETELCQEYMGQFPVIAISLKDVEGLTFESACMSLKNVIGNEIIRFLFLKESTQLSEEEKKVYQSMIEIETGILTMSNDTLPTSILTLSTLLFHHYKKKVILLIDEYDVPIDKAFQYGYHDEMVTLLRSMFGNAL